MNYPRFHLSSFIALLFFAAATCAVLTSCQEEHPDGFIELRFERYHGAKVAVKDCASHWVEGELVRINSTEAPVVHSSGNYYIQAPSESVNRALYPAKLTSAALTGDNVQLQFPSTYHYDYDATEGRQLLETPLAARSTEPGVLDFSHLGAAICLCITNSDPNQTLVLDAATLTSDKYQVCGQRSIDLTDIPGLGPKVSTSDRSVTMLFDGGLALGPGAKVEVAIPILPVGEDNRFTVTVTSHVEGTRYTFSRQQGESDGTASRAILRNQLAYAYVSLATTGDHITAGNHFSADGTTYLVQTPYEFAAMVQAINNGWQCNGISYRDLDFRIANDLDMTGYTVQPINGSAYSHSIDFSSRTISNLTIESALYGTSTTTYHCGLFYGRVRGDLSGLTLDRLILKHRGSEPEKSLFVGAICSDSEAPVPSNPYQISVTNCSVRNATFEMDNAALPRLAYFGGLFGRIRTSGTVDLSQSSVTITASVASSTTLYAGGLVGYRNANVIYARGCTVSGIIDASSSTAYFGNYQGYSNQIVNIQKNENNSTDLTFILNGEVQTGVDDCTVNNS
ncbi:MAG: hypothetical protein J6I49_06585 [Bacteroidales bacterium]|nr:hypothetical protein [Bacteroidales bacterium]